jgi:hypothetical protein
VDPKYRLQLMHLGFKWRIESARLGIVDESPAEAPQAAFAADPCIRGLPARPEAAIDFLAQIARQFRAADVGINPDCGPERRSRIRGLGLSDGTAVVEVTDPENRARPYDPRQ